MTSRYRTAFAVPSGFATSTVVAPRAAAPVAAARPERKAAGTPATGRAARDVKVETRAKSAAA